LWSGPSVVTIFDLSFLRYPERLGRARRLYLQWATRISIARAQRVIAISQSGKQEISALLHVSDSRIDVAVPGVSDRFVKLDKSEIETFRRVRGLPERFILYLGTIEPRKNLDTLLCAYASLPHRREVKMVLAGGQGWQTEQIFALMEQLNLKDDVLLPGFIPEEDLPLWYNAAEVFAYPSIYEGFGIPILEAMACGLPTIASNTSSLPEAVGSAGILLPATDIDAWRDTLSSLLDDPAKRADLAQRGQGHARGFTWHHTARQTVGSYRRALEASS
jgi:glycosyltransferase involved in cell wall biosynthesis